METLRNTVMNLSGRFFNRILVACLLISAAATSISATPEEWVLQSNPDDLTSWSLFIDSSLEEEYMANQRLSGVALSCLPDVNISLGQGGYAVITALTLVNAPAYPANQYSVDIMGPLTNTVYCEQLGQELMVVVTELPTGNSCMSSIFIEDKLRPVFFCTSDTLPCNVDIFAIDFEDYLEPPTDNCDDDLTLWSSFVIQNLPCNPHHFTQQIVVTWTATDDSGNSATCQDIIYLRKPALGQIVFPPNISISCVNANTDPSNTGVPTFNGDPLGFTCQLIEMFTDQVIPMCNGAKKILRTWKVRDWCTSGQVTHVQEILIVDNTPPVLTCPANLTINAGPGICTTKYTLPLPVVTDACATPNQIDIDITVSGVPGIFSPGQMVTLQEGTTLIIIKATDPCGNMSQCMYNVTVRDNTPPVLICPPNVTLDCTASTLPSNTGTATAIDVCDDTPTITYSDVTVATPTCAFGYTITRTWRATDDSGNTITCMQMIVFTDNTPPTIICPANVSIECTASTAPANNGSATATDLCDNTPALTFTDLTVAGTCPQEYAINRTWRATDDCGNSSTCLQVIQVNDNTPPLITCPPDMTIECSESSAPAATGTATASDNCDPTPALIFSDVITPSGPQTFFIDRTWVATDDCGNSSTCLQQILVHDEIPPVILCPANVTVQCTASTLPPATGTATATDNCDPMLAITFLDATVPGICPQERTITRTWTATDDCGNTATCVQTITVDDSIAPTITCPGNVTIACNTSTAPAATGFATATDNCDAVLNITFTDNTTGGSCPQESIITRTWRATDDCGNSSTCIQTITIEDNQAPVILCPANITIACTAVTLPANTGSATATDNCDGTPALTFLDVVIVGSCPQEMNITRTWTATDDCGNSSTCVQLITTEDNLPPSITCPINVTIECTASTFPVNTGSAAASDNCDTAPDLAYSDVSTPGGCPQESTITRTWTATDGCGNSTACVQTIVINDSVAPVISCPANVTIQCNASTMPSNTGTATATDNCDSSPTVNFTDVTVGGGCPQEYSITRTWVATDDCGNSSSCVQTIVIDDSLAPTITCPVNVTIQCDDSSAPANTGTATASDNCDAIPVVNFTNVTVSGGCPQEYTITRTWSATDDCGNIATCAQIIVVDDSEAPVISCPGNVTISCTESTLPVNTGNATAIDNCDTTPEVTFSDVIADGGCAVEDFITRTWIATDACGNSSTCVQTISLIDDVAPTIDCPDNVTIECVDSTLPASTGTATATDNCTVVPDIDFNDVTSGGGCPQAFLITRTWIATDDCGNSSTCVQLILVDDNVAPLITCPVNVTIQCGESTLPGNTGMATSTDGCDPAPVVNFSDITVAGGGNCPEGFSISRTWTATDACGNSTTCIQLISIDDNEAPLITCPANITLQCDDDTTPANTGFASAIDNCDETPSVDFSDITTGAGCPDGYIITRTWVAEDDCGNSSSCIQTITVDDTEAPLVVCPVNVVIACTASTLPANTGSASASDACDETPDLDFSDIVANGSCPQEFVITRTWIATDDCGNTGTCNQIIEVQDNVAPVCLTANITVSLNGIGFVTILPSQVDAGSTDNCGPVTLSVAPNSFDCDNIGENVVVLTVTDCPGNSSTCTAIVTIEDTEGLEAICQNITINLDANGNAFVNPEDIDNGSGGGCIPGELEFDLSQTDFNCTDLGQNIVTLTVTDEEGNSAQCTAIITVIDQIPPAITCPANVTVDCNVITDPNNTGQFGNATAMDNCPGVSINENFVINLNDCGVGTIVRTFVATDASGNTSSCVQTVTVTNPNPLSEEDIDWPNSPVNVNICNSTAPGNIPNGVPVIDPTALQCANPEITFVDQVQMIIDNNPNTPCRIITRTWTIVDDCQPNGIFVFVQTINVTDAVPPLFTNINNMTKVANSNCVAPFTIIASATDCAGVSITNDSPYGVNNGANASGNYPIGVTTVIFTATDGCGNISTMDVVITVTDPDPTEFMCEKTLIFLPEETEITLPADTFVTFIQGNCTTGDDFIVSYSGTDPFDTLNTYDCGDVGVTTFSLWLWTEDGSMVVDSCQTADLDLRDPLDHCMDGLILVGEVENEDGLDVSGVEVSILNAPMTPDTTDQKGRYIIEGLSEGIGYHVAPFDDDHHREGVSTLDLVLIQKHLLGKAKLNSPYKIIAADANNNGNVTAIDLLEIRKLILGLNNKFPNNTSWRFVDSRFSFINPYNPFTPPFPESVWIDSVTVGSDTADFVAIKIGDVNGSYFLNRNQGSQIKPRSGGEFSMTIKSVTDAQSGKSTWNLSANEEQGMIDGMQFSFFTGGLTMEQVAQIRSELLTPDQWVYHPESRMILVSWSAGSAEDLTGKLILSIPDPGIAMDIVRMDNGRISPEAYRVENSETTVRDIEIAFDKSQVAVSNEYHLFQNIPNPFSEFTKVRFYLPGEEKVSLMIHDIAGRQVYIKELAGMPGINEISVRKQDLGLPGLYYYTLYTSNASFTNKMTLTND